MRRLCTLVVVVVAIAGAPARAHVSVPTEFREVVSESSLIVRGRVTDVRSLIGAGDRIESIATVAVENVLKGQASGFVYVRVPGGEVGRSRVVMVGAPTFRTGQRAVFFLKPDSVDSSLRPIGLSMGVFFVQSEPRTGRPVIAPPLVAGSTTARTGPAVRGDTRRRFMQIRDFEALVRLVMATNQAQAVRRGGAR